MTRLLATDKGQKGDSLTEYLRTVNRISRSNSFLPQKRPPPLSMASPHHPQNAAPSHAFPSSFSGRRTLTPSSVALKSIRSLQKMKQQYAGVWCPLEGGTLGTKSATLTAEPSETSPFSGAGPVAPPETDQKPRKRSESSASDNEETAPPEFTPESHPEDAAPTAEDVCRKLRTVWDAISTSSASGDGWISNISGELASGAAEPRTPSYEALLRFLYPTQLPLLFCDCPTKEGIKSEYEAEVDANNKGHREITAGKYEKAVRHFSKRLARHPLDLGAGVGLFVAYYLMGRLREASAQIDFMQRYYQKNVSVLYNKALCDMENGKYESCVQVTTRAFIASSKAQGSTKIALPYSIAYLYQLRAIAYFQLGYLRLSSKDFVLSEKCRGLKGCEGRVLAKHRSRTGVTVRVSMGVQPHVSAMTSTLDEFFVPRRNQQPVLPQTDKIATLATLGKKGRASSTISNLLNQCRPMFASMGEGVAPAAPNPSQKLPSRQLPACLSCQMTPSAAPPPLSLTVRAGTNEFPPADLVPAPESDRKRKRADDVSEPPSEPEERASAKGDELAEEQEMLQSLLVEDSDGEIEAGDVVSRKSLGLLADPQRYTNLITALDSLKARVEQEGFKEKMLMNPKTIRMRLRGHAKDETMLEQSDLDLIKEELTRVRFLSRNRVRVEGQRSAEDGR